MIENRQARFQYHIEDKFEAGLALKGAEVKSIREGGFELKESFILTKDGELYIEGAYIKPYVHQGKDPLSPTRRRKLLLNRREINRLTAEVQRNGMSIVPLKAYFKRGRIKLEIGLGKGKKNIMKRETIKKRETERNMRRMQKIRK
ncbi:MAG: SsrA-binding protein SmpB [Bdellovibrionales bacterium]|nr:SsrA-binding protein SmpB [Bdellovibrionales bacterium]